MSLSVPKTAQKNDPGAAVLIHTGVRSGDLIPETLTVFLIVHALVWISVPLLFIDGMHVDTLEMAAWARDWAFGYPKHPPLGTWLVSLAVRLPGLKIFNILVLAQLCTVTSGIFIWKAVRLFSSQAIAAVAVIAFLESASATIFSVQLNHNLLSMPFEAALLYLGLKFMERPTWRAAVALGTVAGLAVLAKYETIFFHLTLLMVAAAYPRYRSVLLNPRFALAVAIVFIVVGPHLYWDYAHGWPTLTHATADRAASSLWDYLSSLNNFAVGSLTVVIAPLGLLMTTKDLRKARMITSMTPMGLLIALLPFGLLAALSLATAQVVRQGWLLPLAPALFVGFALQGPNASVLQGFGVGQFAKRAVMLCVAQAVLFATFIIARSAFNHPVAAYALDSSVLSERLLAYWDEHGQGPLNCIAVPEASRNLTLGPVLYIEPAPKFVFVTELTDLGAACPEGGLGIIPVTDPLSAAAAGTPGETLISVAPETGIGSWEWRYRLVPLQPR